MSRRVKGLLFVEYVRMLRARKNVSWDAYLTPEDLPYLSQTIELQSWYPMSTFERMGIAILDEIAARQLDLVRYWGRRTIDGLHQAEPSLFVAGDIRETLMRFQVLRRSLFDYPAVEIGSIRDGGARFLLKYGMGPRAEEAACHQSMGFLERLLELAGARDIEVELVACTWKGSPETIVGVRWKKN